MRRSEQVREFAGKSFWEVGLDRDIQLGGSALLYRLFLRTGRRSMEDLHSRLQPVSAALLSSKDGHELGRVAR